MELKGSQISRGFWGNISEQGAMNEAATMLPSHCTLHFPQSWENLGSVDLQFGEKWCEWTLPGKLKQDHTLWQGLWAFG